MPDSLTTHNLAFAGACSCSTASSIYQTGRQTCQNLFDLSQSVGRSSRDDLLRATLIFACSTIDSIGKQLVGDCLTELINNDQGAQKKFEDHIKREIKKEPEKILPRALASPDYRAELIKTLKEDFDGNSLQSYSQLAKLTGHFGIATDSVISADDARKVFDSRQTIIHEMDIVPVGTGVNGNQAQRRARAEGELKDLTEKVLIASKKLIDEVHSKIHG